MVLNYDKILGCAGLAVCRLLDKLKKVDEVGHVSIEVNVTMTDIHDQEMGFFVDSLSPHQRVYLQRMLGEFLTAVPKEDDSGTIDLAMLGLIKQSSEGLFDLLGHLRKFEANDSDSDIRPFAFNIPEPGHAIITLSTRILNWRGLWDPKSHDWLDGVTIGRLTVDLKKLEEVNSSTIAWLVMLAGRLPDRRVYLANVSDRIRRSIDVLKLADVLQVASQRQVPTAS